MDCYIDPKDARKLVWSTAPPGDLSDADSDDDRYSRPYDSDENGTFPGGRPESDSNYDVPPSHEDDYNRLSTEALHPAVKNRNAIPGVDDHTYNHTPTWNAQKAERQNIQGSDVGEPLVVTRNSSHKNSQTIRRSGGIRKGSSSIPDEGRPIPQSNAIPSLYEEAWDTSEKQKRIEAALRLARTMSTTSDSFEDALEYQLEEPAPPPTKPARVGLKTDPATDGMYEQAWDLNRGLEEKLRKVQLMHSDAGGTDDTSASDTYQEPWDTQKKQRELEDKLQQASAGVGGPLSPKLLQQSKDSGLYEEAWDIKRKSLTQMMMASHGLEGGIMSQASTCSNQSIKCSVAGEPVNAMIPLDSQDWYHGNISRDDAEKILCVCKNSSYLVRDSSDGIHYTLCIKTPRQIIHIQIDECLKKGNKGYILGKNSKVFDTIPAMIDYYTQHPVPIHGADHITLLYPVQCHWSKS